MPDLSVEQFQSLSQIIYQKLGLHFDEKKIYFLKTRVSKRMAALGIDNPRDYLFLISYADPKGVEMQALANLVTTNETYMFPGVRPVAGVRQSLPAGSAIGQAGARRKDPSDLVRWLLFGRRSIYAGDDPTGRLPPGPVLGLRDHGD
jgi:hypothetical protein